MQNLWKHHYNHLREIYQRNEHKHVPSCNNNPTFEAGQPVMVRNHAHHTIEPKYLLDYRVLQILNDSTLLIVTPDGKERKMSINDVKLSNTSKLVKNAWDTFLGSIKSIHITLDLGLNFWQTSVLTVFSAYTFRLPRRVS